MQLDFRLRCRVLYLALFLFTGAPAGFSGISREIQEQYRQNYENKAMFLKIPVYSERQFIYITGQAFRVIRETGLPRYKVGDQLRILALDFKNDEINFRMSGIAVPGSVEISFKFDSNLQESFPNRDVFDKALQSTFTEGLTYTDIEAAKQQFVEEQFDRSIGEIAGSASISRESVLKSIAPQVPAYQDAQREIDALKRSRQAISDQLSQSQAENRRLDSMLKAQESQMAQLKKSNAELQENTNSSALRLSNLEKELRDVKGKAQEYQRELASIRSSLNLEADAKRDLANQIGSLRTNLDAQKEANARLQADNEELRSNNRKMQSTIATLTSKENSLAKQYLDLKNEKEKLDILYQSMEALHTRIAEEKVEGGIYRGRANVYLKDVLLGFFDWSIPTHLSHKQSKSIETNFSTESIDYVRVTQEERQMLRSLGEKLKIQVDLVPESAAIDLRPESDEPFRELGERDHAAWRWQISNQGAQDTRLLLTARLINRNSKEIVLLQKEPSIISTNVVRRVRSYLQPIPLVAGILIGFLLFGIVGIFRRPQKQVAHRKQSDEGPSEPPPYLGQKQL